MLIRELGYDTESDELDLLIDTLTPEPAESVDVGDDVLIRRSLKTGKIVGATIVNYSIWRPGRFPMKAVDPELAVAYQQIIHYLHVIRQQKVVSEGGS